MLLKKKYSGFCVTWKIWGNFFGELMRHIWMETMTILLNTMKISTKLKKKWNDLGLQIQMTLMRESLMPDSRDDLLWFLTKLDKVPSSFKHSLGAIVIEKPEIPQDFQDPLKKMLAHTHDAVKALAHATDSLFTDLRAVRQHVEEVGRQESEVDKVEYKLLRTVLRMKI
jgi:Phosphate transport regulator (distant homolog of PhoU)